MEARRAFGDVGSAQPGDSATNAGPRASAVRMSVPTFPGSATRQSARPPRSSVPTGRSSRRKTAITAGRVRERRELREEGGLDLLGRQPVEERRPLGVDERLDGLETGVEPRLDEILALADEEARACRAAVERRACGRASDGGS